MILKNSAKMTFVIWMLLLSSGAAEQEKPSWYLDVYLPRKIQVKEPELTIGCVGVLCGNEKLIETARPIALGRFTMPGQKITLDRDTVASCLAGGGIDARRIRIKGAECVEISREESVLHGEELAAIAEKFLKTQLGEAAAIKSVRVPQDLVQNRKGAFEIIPTEGQMRADGRRRVILSLCSDGKEFDQVEVEFEVLYPVQQAAAAVPIASGQTISREMIRIETVQDRRPQSSDPMSIVGQTAKRSIPAGSVIQPQWAAPPVPPVLIERRQKVILRLSRGALQVTAAGEAMDEGKVGDVVRIKRGIRPDERIVLGKVMPDGTVEPLL